MSTAGLTIADLTWVNPTHGWALGIARKCGSRVCPETLLATTDGGSHWTSVQTMHAPTNCVFGCAPLTSSPTPQEANIRFVTDEIGFAFGESDQPFMMTTDSGHTWIRQPGRKVVALEVAGTNMIRVSYSHTGCPGPCDWGIDIATVGSTVWHPLRIPRPTGNISVQLVRSGPKDIYVAFFGNPASGCCTQTADLLVSHDGGQTWTRRNDPCSIDPNTENDSYAITAARDGVVASLCKPRSGNGNGGFIVISHDGASTFGPAQPLPSGIFADSIAITSPTTVFVSGSGGNGHPSGPRLYASHDSGTHWSVAVTEPSQTDQQVVTPANVLHLFNAPDGYWLGYNQTLWTTTDSGQHWTPHTIQ
jgi:photosystem II stability/assembly factor-like uncharacterized protein